MLQQGQRRFAISLMVMGFLLALMSLPGDWGVAYAGTGPSPTPGEGKLHIKKEACTFDAGAKKQDADEDCKILALTNPADDRFNLVPGDRFSYRILLTNTGLAPVTQLVMSDVIPARLTILSARTSEGTLTQQGQLVVVNIARLRPGTTAVVRIHVRIKPDAGPVMRNHEERIINTAYARAEGISTQSSWVSVGVYERKAGTAAGSAPSVAAAAPVVHQPLLASGAMLFLSGAFLFRRQRKQR